MSAVVIIRKIDKHVVATGTGVGDCRQRGAGGADDRDAIKQRRRRRYKTRITASNGAPAGLKRELQSRFHPPATQRVARKRDLRHPSGLTTIPTRLKHARSSPARYTPAPELCCGVGARIDDCVTRAPAAPTARPRRCRTPACIHDDTSRLMPSR
jgi:hypothetical protein